MSIKTQKIIRYIVMVIAVAMLVLFILYEFAGKKWAGKPFFLTMALVCLCNLFFNTKTKQNND